MKVNENNVNQQTKELINSLRNKSIKRILFVCLGNICRSPAAQGIFETYVSEEGLQGKLEADSAGLYGGHAGELPDRRMRIHATKRGYDLQHRSRPVSSSDFSRFDLIVAMDRGNYDGLKRLAPTVEDEGKIVMMTDFVSGFPHYDHVPDPYYEGSKGFELVLDMLEDGCRNLVESLR